MAKVKSFYWDEINNADDTHYADHQIDLFYEQLREEQETFVMSSEEQAAYEAYMEDTRHVRR
tara:strand:+ start:399 stop:584 length:186 start_codon:yes stop_codon:yes gene_type:complete